MPKRSTKFYRRNEAELMKELGLIPTKNSGSGWIEKADGQNDNVVCELKSTDAQSYRLNLQDLHKVEHQAEVANKIPVFAVQYLSTNDVYLIMKPEVLEDLAKYLRTGVRPDGKLIDIDLSETENLETDKTRKIKSSLSAREKFKMENDAKFKKGGKSAR